MPEAASYTVIRVRADRVGTTARPTTSAPVHSVTPMLLTSSRPGLEAVNDPDRIVDEPDPQSVHANSVRLVGYSLSAVMVITVVALRDPQGVLHGASAWRTTGKPRRQYWEGRPDD